MSFSGRGSPYLQSVTRPLTPTIDSLLHISPLENAYSWVTESKPSSVFKLVYSIRINGVPSSSLVELTQEHMRKIEALRVKIRLEEEKVERQQVTIADRKMAELVRLVLQVKNGEQVRQAEGLV
ncbi:protein DOG1-like 4 [Hevea brasiliensis]|uniref:protein DOG1-like 4 n=1 Tax=Hevea brasiliensis TaxID=3981 RepID=UPI0025CF9A16|nr:protein DOG1-like 4 [Hevea brasiliensis]